MITKEIVKVLTAAFIAAASLAASADNIIVVDENNQPVSNATILLGFEPGNPFGGNVINTGTNGQAEAPTDWKAALPVTVQANGYVTTTLPVLMPGEHRIQISKADGTAKIEIKGTTKEFGRLIKDGKVDFGMVLPALSRKNMLAFDISAVISPENDTIDVIGNSADIPSNLTLPEQEESYIFPITLDKPVYRTYVRAPGSYQMYALHGQFPLQKVVNDIRAGKSIFEVINHFTFIDSGSRTVQVEKNIDKVDIAVNQTKFNSNVAVKAPAYPAGKVMVSLALSEQNGEFVPTDLKRFTPNQQISLKSNPSLGTGSVLSLLVDEPTNIVTRIGEALLHLSPFDSFVKPMTEQEKVAAKNYEFNKMSFAFLPAQGTVQPQFLPMVAKPELANNIMRMEVPSLPNGLSPAAMYLVMSEIEEIASGKVKSERRTRLWEVWSEGWLPQIEMPKITFARKPDRKYRWEVIFLARPSHFTFEVGPTNRVDLNSVTHVTRNALDL